MMIGVLDRKGEGRSDDGSVKQGRLLNDRIASGPLKVGDVVVSSHKR
jgi:hypothetical protein